MADLLDANVLIALVVREHEHHSRAAAWLASAGEVAVCPVVEGALARFLVRIGEGAQVAGRVIAGLWSRCEFWPDDVSYADIDLTRVQGHRQVTDAYLVALAVARGGRLATFDKPLAALYPQACELIATS